MEKELASFSPVNKHVFPAVVVVAVGTYNTRSSWYSSRQFSSSSSLPAARRSRPMLCGLGWLDAKNDELVGVCRCST